MHPLNELENRREAGRVFSCFPTLESFTDALGDEPIPEDDFSAVSDDIDGDGTPLEENCTKLARVLLRNHPIAKHAAAHFFYDTRLVMDWANINTTRTPILAVRTEQMWDDWISVNQWLGQEHVATFPEVKGRVFDKDQYKVKKEISETGQRRLCRALIPEYRVYLKTSFKAVNLSPEDKDRSFQLAMKNCGPEIEQAMIAER